MPLPALLSRSLDVAAVVSLGGGKAGPNLRAITALQAAIKDAHEGKRQFLSGETTGNAGCRKREAKARPLKRICLELLSQKVQSWTFSTDCWLT